MHKKAEIKWYWLNTKNRLDYVNIITRESMELSDLLTLDIPEGEVGFSVE